MRGERGAYCISLSYVALAGAGIHPQVHLTMTESYHRFFIRVLCDVHTRTGTFRRQGQLFLETSLLRVAHLCLGKFFKYKKLTSLRVFLMMI